MTNRIAKNRLAAEDRELFLAEGANSPRLVPRHWAEPPGRRRRPVATQRLRDDHAVLQASLSDHIAWDPGLESGEEPVFLRNGIAAQTLKRLRRGYWVIQDELDLHGLTTPEARMLLVEFLNRCTHHGLRCVRIIHGKGLRSKNREPVLKHKVAHWLMQRDEILAFCQARRTEGGSGALMVLLKGAKHRT
ncbi:MAG: Smr/MutS family protein [Burkholderiales bacterium]